MKRKLVWTLMGALALVGLLCLNGTGSAQESRHLEGTYTCQKLQQGTVFKYHVFIPRQYDGSQPAALTLSFDGLFGINQAVVEKLIDEGAMPVCVCVGVVAGELPPTLEGGFPRFMRGEEYDQVGSDFPNFIVDEFLPWLIKKEQLNINPSPDMHAVSGGSSGGICAWNFAWYRNDCFHRAFMSSPTFSCIRDGVEPMVVARKAETRPIRCYVSQGTNEPNLWAGDSYVAALLAKSALDFAGYPMMYELFEGGGHCHGAYDPAVLERAWRFIWKDWKTEPVKPLHNQPYLNEFLEFGTAWEETTDAFPTKGEVSTAMGTYCPDGERILLRKKTADGSEEVTEVAKGFGDVRALAISSDGWRLYIADAKSRFAWVMSIMPDGSLAQRYKHAPLHLTWDCRTIGGTDLCVDVSDRLYVATELGIQCCRSMGVVDGIVPLPGDVPVEKIAFGGKDFSVMYATGGGKTFKRPWKVKGLTPGAKPVKPTTWDYYR